ncbi:hypothetical protein AYO38_02175 [bacterium SCGC AG-212-C10]|nr:hypothetical protein AYO38_02175 [bacterium SCGC AG-212-C10]
MRGVTTNVYRAGGLAAAALVLGGWATTRVGYAVPLGSEEEYLWRTEAGATAPAPETKRLIIPGVQVGTDPFVNMLLKAPKASDGYFGYPLADWTAVTDRYLTPRGEDRVHGAIDLGLATFVHSPVYAACAGTVTVSSFSPNTTQDGYGNYVIIQCDSDWSTVYGHFSANLVTAGQKVTKGWPIGISGSTGNSTGEHLHFEIRYEGKQVDPEAYLDFGQPPYESPKDPNAPEVTPTPAASPTLDGSVTPTPTPADGGTDDHSIPSPTETPLGTPTPTGTTMPPSATGTPTPHGTETPTATGTPATATPTPHGTETATATPEETVAPPATPSPTATATPTPRDEAKPAVTPTVPAGQIG